MSVYTGDYSAYIRDDSIRRLPGAAPDLVVFTLAMDRLDYTKRMVDALRRTAAEPFAHIVIDQASTDGTPAYLAALEPTELNPVVRVLTLVRNIGISAASNLALDLVDRDHGDARYVLKLDNDCELLDEGWDRAFREICSRAGDRIVLSPFVCGLRENSGGAPRMARAEVAVDGVKHDIGLTQHLGGICEFSHRDSYRGFRFDEADTLSGSQDSSFSRWVLSNGYWMGYVEDLHCEHMDTTNGQHEKYPEYFRRRAEIESRRSYLEVKDEPLPAATVGDERGISVVLGVYNHAGLLGKTLPEWTRVCAGYAGGSELIVCDDGSDDGTQELVERFAAEHADGLRVLYLRQENVGRPRLAVSLNQSLPELTLPYTLFAMGDSYPRPDLLDAYAPHLAPDTVLSGLREQVAEVFASESSPDYRKGEAAFQAIDRSPRPWEGFTGNNFVMPTEMLRRIGGWNEGFQGYGAEDWELAAFAFYREHARFKPIPEAVVCHVIHPVREGSGDGAYYLAAWFQQLAARYAAGDFDRSTDDLQPREQQ